MSSFQLKQRLLALAENDQVRKHLSDELKSQLAGLKASVGDQPETLKTVLAAFLSEYETKVLPAEAEEADRLGSSAEGHLKALKASVDELEKAVAGLQRERSDIQTEMGKTDEKLTDLESKLKVLK